MAGKVVGEETGSAYLAAEIPMTSLLSVKPDPAVTDAPESWILNPRRKAPAVKLTGDVEAIVPDPEPVPVARPTVLTPDTSYAYTSIRVPRKNVTVNSSEGMQFPHVGTVAA
jgi:hypothetical protein